MLLKHNFLLFSIFLKSKTKWGSGFGHFPIYIYIYNFQADAIPKVYIEEGCKLFGIVSTYSPARYKT